MEPSSRKTSSAAAKSRTSSFWIEPSFVHVFGDKLIFAYEPFRFAVGLKLRQSHIVRLFIGVYGLGRVHAGSLVRNEGYGAVQKAVCPLIVAGGYFRQKIKTHLLAA